MPEQYSGIIMIVVMVAIFYFLLIRPESKRKKQAQQMRDSLKKGDMITSIGGIVGKIVHVTENTIVIETSDQPETKKEKKEEKKDDDEKAEPAKIEEKPAESPAEIDKK